jgi:hypothetical protein
LTGNNFVETDDPLVLDLDHNGYSFAATASFDIDADGAADQVAWNSSGDGMLAYDLDGDGVINDGSELFTPDFAGGGFVSGGAALASLDGNGDGIIDADDAAFANLSIWKDANADGITDAGELTSLADNGIASISAPAAPADSSIDGQSIIGEGAFTLADGTTGSYIEIALETAFGNPDDMANAITGTEGADSFMIDPSALTQVGVVEVIADYSKAEGDRLDLGDLLEQALGAPATNGDAVHIQQNGGNTDVVVDTNGADAGGDVVVATLTGIHNAVTILYDQTHEADVTTSA